MLAPMYINTNLGHQQSLKHSQSIHIKKIKVIKTRRPGSNLSIPSDPVNLPKVSKRWNSVSNIRSEEIKQQNLKMLEKLLDISIKAKPSASESQTAKQGKSLNIEKRLKFAKAIEKDNQKIAERIKNSGPEIIMKEFDKDYEMFLKCRNRISRFQVLKKRRGKHSEDLDSGRKNFLISPSKFASPCLWMKNLNYL